MTTAMPGKDRFTVLKTVGLYALFGIVWVCFSDSMLGRFVHDQAFFKYLTFLKGILFILFTAALFFFLINRYRQRSMPADSLAMVEEALRESEAAYRTIFDNHPHSVLLCKMTGEFVDVNARFVEFAGRPRSEILGKMPVDLGIVDQATYESLLHEFQQRGGNFNQFEVRLWSPGRDLWIDTLISSRIIQVKGEPMALFITNNITALKQAEESLKKVAEQYRSIFEKAAEGILIAEIASKRFRYANPAICTMLGCTEDELLRMSSQDIHPKESLDAVLTEFNALAQGAKIRTVGIPCLRKDGTVIYADISGSLISIDNVACYLGFFADSTERRRAEIDLRDSEQRYRSLYEGSRDGFCRADMEGRLLEFNTIYQEMLGYTAKELLGKSYKEITPACWEEAEDRIVKEQIMVRGYSDVYEKEYIRKDGTVFPIEHRSYLIKKDGNNVGMWGVTRDITERHRADEERLKLIAAIEQAQEAIMISDKDGIIQYVNASFERLLGFAKDEVLGKEQTAFARSQSSIQVHLQVWDSISQGNGWSGTITTRNKKGSDLQLEVAISPIRTAQGAVTSFVSIARDITKELMMEEQLRQSQKMEAIGTLAGGIAHDFNNILAAILGYTELAERDAPEGSATKYNLGQVLKAADRARALVKQILAFSRKADQERQTIKLQRIIKEALKLLRATIPTTIEVVPTINDDPGYVIADPIQMHQVLINLCMNAAHAMQESGGTLEVGLVPVDLGETDVEMFSDLRPGPYLKLTVRDTGTGIDPAIIERIFDPFFTTKEVDKGTGMGLSVVHGIVKSHGGAITVDSRPGEGTVFAILLPRAVEGIAEEHTLAASLPAGTECILFADDEDALVQLGCSILSSLGYRVVPAKGSLEALALFQQEPSRFDLVITDQTMPQMTGVELARRLHQIRPEIPIILCTGFSEAVDDAKVRELNIQAFVMKPVKLREIAGTIRKVLDKNAHG